MHVFKLIFIFKLLYSLYSCESVSKVRQYDFVIVGRTPAGLTLAHELSETSDVSILILDADTNDKSTNNSTYLDELGNETETQHFVPRTGDNLGGISELSSTIYSQGFKNDYDVWGENNPGWSYKEIKKYFLKVEKRHKILHPSKYSKRMGLIETRITTVGVTFLKAMKQLGYVQLPNAHKNHTKPGYSRLVTYSKHHSITPLLTSLYQALIYRKNVSFKVGAVVTKITMNPVTKWASAVLARFNGRLYRIVAKKEIILCAGAVANSEILLKSGIGTKHDLTELGMKVLADLPVGKEIKDHAAYPGLNYMTNFKIKEKELEETRITDGAEALAFISLDKNQTFTRPDIQLLVFNEFLNREFKDIKGVSSEYYEDHFKEVQNIIGMHIFPILLHPKSSYQIKLRNKQQNIQIHYFEDEEDLEKMTRAVMFVDNHVATTSAFYQKAAILYPVSVCLGLPYKSKDYWKCAIKKIMTTFEDYTGGCRMGPSSRESVVDNKLMIHGLKNVRVADASVIPTTISAPLEATVIMVARKAADLIRESYNISRK